MLYELFIYEMSEKNSQGCPPKKEKIVKNN